MREKDTVKKSMMFQYNHYTDLERKLEKYAAQGLSLESIGSFFWTFKRREPKNVHYTVTFFAEGSIFHPKPTENQEVYYDYAEASGWHFIAEHGQMQIFMSEEEHPYRTVEVVLSANATWDYEIFSDAIPLTAQDLYKDASHPDYSYEKEMEETIFMKQTSYYQGLYPMKNPPPEIRYNIIECKMDWTFDVAMDSLLELEEWQTETYWEEIDTTPFGADKAYHRLYGGEPTGTYHLCYDNTIISLFLEEALTDEATEVVIKKLNL